MNIRKPTLGILILMLLLPFFLRAENGNPFGGAESFPPPGSEYQDDEDMVDPNIGPGFQPPPGFGNPLEQDSATVPSAQPNYPPPTNNQPPPTRSSSPPVRTVINPSPVTPSSRTYPTKDSNGKKAAAPTLPQYLELNSSVKSLEVKNFDLPDKEIKDVVTLISKWTGKNFIIDSKVRGKITIMGPAQVTLQEAYQAFLSALEANGLTTVQAGKFIRIIESTEARRSPVKTYAGDYAPKDDQFITRIFQLKFINADEVQKEFRDLTTRQGKLFAYEPTNSLIITDTGSNIQRIREILDVLDIKGFETTLHVMKIRHNSAKAISDMLGEIYGDEKSRPGQPRSFRKSALERTRGGGIISKIIPDEQTNALIVLANESGYIQLKQLVGKLDVKVTDTGRIHVYYCEYAKAEDLANTLASLSGGGGSTPRSSRRTSATSPNAVGFGNMAPTAPMTSGPVSAQLDNGVKITSDPATNALVVIANSSEYQTLKKVIRKLDIPRLQVFVETAILEVVLDDSTNLGVNVAFGAPGVGFAGGFLGNPNAITTALSRGIPGEGATIPIFAGPSFDANVNIGGTSTPATVTTFMGLLNLLTKTTNSSLLSTPQILAMDNEKAEFQVLDETPVISSTTAATANSGPVQSTERLKTGIVIKLTPHVNAASGAIRLDIEQKVDSIRSTTDVPKLLQESNRATTSRVTNTSVVVRDKDYLMMGGLISDKVDEAITKVPLLGDIPILGWLFKSRSTKTIKTNLVILLHPQIINTTLSSATLSRKALDKRKEFIRNNMSDEEPHPEGISDIDTGLEEQFERAKTQPEFNYQNTGDDDIDSDEPQRETKNAIRPNAKAGTNNTSPPTGTPGTTSVVSPDALTVPQEPDPVMGIPPEKALVPDASLPSMEASPMAPLSPEGGSPQ